MSTHAEAAYKLMFDVEENAGPANRKGSDRVKVCLIVLSASGRSVSTRCPQVGTTFVSCPEEGLQHQERAHAGRAGRAGHRLLQVQAMKLRTDSTNGKRGSDQTIFGQCLVHVDVQS